jgi:prepilin-type N-terminal cleavage/methylation domain-containing protein
MPKLQTPPPTAVSSGFSLVELMIAIAIIAILSSIAIPLYNGYIREGHFATLRTDLNSLRTPIEDFRLDSAGYTDTGPPNLNTYIADVLGDVNSGNYTYTVLATGTNSYDAWGVLNANTWIRCEDRFRNCCDSETAGATAPDEACP